ncbi:MAG: fasciclin domain-containing protein [Myxococcales bacterium]|nr:fasciclin domain-containing protein [Myxococcales bacterium]
MKNLRSFAFAAASLALFACSDDANTTPAPAPSPTPTTTTPTPTPTTTGTTPTPGPQNIVDTAVAAGSFKTLAAALGAAGLVDTLKGPGPFTVFAPTDDAFAKLPAGTVDTLLKPENKAALTDILTYHVVSGNVKAADVVKLKYAESLQGGDLKIKVSGSDVFINDTIKVTKTDIVCTNGVIHVLDAVLASPPKNAIDTAKAAGSFTTLLAAVDAAGLTETLKGKGPFTIFAPTDAAFQKLPAGTVTNLLLPENKAQLESILKYHVVSGKVRSDKVVTLTKAPTLLPMEEVTIKVDAGNVFLNNDVKVSAVDVDASNGVIHVIDSVLLPPKK